MHWKNSNLNPFQDSNTNPIEWETVNEQVKAWTAMVKEREDMGNEI